MGGPSSQDKTQDSWVAVLIERSCDGRAVERYGRTRTNAKHSVRKPILGFIEAHTQHPLRNNRYRTVE